MPQNQPKDLMTYLLDLFRVYCQEQGRETEPTHRVVEFAEFCQEKLAENQPVSMDYLESGFAVRLQDGTVVPFTDSPVQSTGGIQGGIELTRPDTRKDKGIDHANSFSFDITGKQNE